MKTAIALLGCLGFYLSALAQSYGDYRVVVLVEGNGFAHQTVVYFDDESWDPQNPPSYSWDACCDALLILGNANQPQVFTQVVEPPASPNNHRLSINGLPHVFEHTVVPLGFLPGTLAPYTFTFKQLYTLPQGMTVELEDLSLNVTQDLLADSTYDTWGAPSDDEERFALHFYPANVTGVSATERANNINITADLIRVDGLLDEICELTLFDGLGRNVLTHSFVGELNLVRNQLKLENGLYIIQIRTKGGSLIDTRKFIN